MAKIAKTLRFEAALIEQAEELQQEGESESALYVRLIEKGIEAYKEKEGAQERTESAVSSLQAEQDSGAQTALITALQEHINDLQKQLETKDGQIEALQNITQAAQALHGGAIVKAQATGQGRFKRAFYILTGKEK